MKTLRILKRQKAAGYSLAESIVSLGIGAVAVAGGFAISQHEMRIVKSVRESNAASHALEERIEQLRLVNWKQMTDGAYLTTYYFPAVSKSGTTLPGLKEKLTVSAFPDPRACIPLSVERDELGTTRIVTSSPELANQRLAQVNARVSWVGKDGKERVRELASIISNAGINATSLPPMGTDAGASSSSGTTTATTSETTETTTTPTTTAPTTTTTTTPTTTTTTTTSNGNGNGNGNGNAGGKSGKK